MKVYAYCFMPNHVYLIFRSRLDDPAGLIRDFKGYTSKKLIKVIEENPPESHQAWLLWLMERSLPF